MNEPVQSVESRLSRLEGLAREHGWHDAPGCPGRTGGDCSCWLSAPAPAASPPSPGDAFAGLLSGLAGLSGWVDPFPPPPQGPAGDDGDDGGRGRQAGGETSPSGPLPAETGAGGWTIALGDSDIDYVAAYGLFPSQDAADAAILAMRIRWPLAARQSDSSGEDQMRAVRVETVADLDLRLSGG